MNVPPLIGMAVSSGKASLADLGSVLDLEDLHDVIEIALVDAHNARAMKKKGER